MTALMTVVLLDLAFTALGRRLLQLIGFKLEAGEELAFSFVCGAGTTGLLVLGAGMLGFLRPWVAWGIVFAPLAVCYEDVAVVVARVWQGVKGVFCKQYPRLARLALIILLMNVAVSVVAALAPPTGADVLSARLAIPKAYVEAGRVIYLPSNLHANLPGNVEMLYALCMLFGSDVVPQLLHLCFGVVLLLGIYFFAARRFSPALAALSCLLFYSLTDVVTQFSTAYSDLAVAAFSFHVFVAWARWWELNERKGLVMAGTLAGAAAGSKLNALGVLVTILFAVGIASRYARGNKMSRAMGDALLVFVPGLVVFLPWLIKNISLTGNPLYPLFAGVLGGRALRPAESALFFAHAMRNSAIQRGPLALVALPWNITMFGPYTSGTIGPLFLMVLPLLPWLDAKPSVFRPIGWFAVGFAGLWYWGSPFVRFALVLLALLSIVTVWGLAELCRQSKYARAVGMTFAGVWFAVATGNNVRVCEVTFPVQLRLESREEYLKRALPVRGGFCCFEDLQWMNANLPRDAKVLSWSRSNYYLERPWIFLGRLHAYTDTRVVGSPEAFLESLRTLGISHLFVLDGLEDSGYRPVPLANEFVERLVGSGALRETWRRAGVHVYELCARLPK